MSEIADFLRARYAERRALAVAACQGGHGRWHQDDAERYPGRIEDERGRAVVYDEGSPSEEQAAHIATNDPADVIADGDAKLAIVDEHPSATGWDGDNNDGKVCRTRGEINHDGELTGNPYPCRTLRILARPFAGHPDHRGEEWAP
ncbi:DUF6221 family protein [Streptomyces sp. MZ04]|uniref:DUF6221 family protein n=1 Tax=Streptomyces sp. MZ04 TaxID=2559236 RepID=UPI00107E80B4|nr:DUF6221 family protein [Streptomyces sp. MZ04]TGB13874.1 hypothetical protein E2651_08010 [Streptomyces sp. MZ04]